MLVRQLPYKSITPIEKACRQAKIEWFEMDHFLRGEQLTLASHITISTMDRLYIPELLPGLDKVIYLDIDLIVQGDIGELYDTNLSQTAIAARAITSPCTGGSMFTMIKAIGKNLPVKDLFDFS